MSRIRKAAVVLKPATLTKYRSAPLSRNYHQLSSSRKTTKPGPKGPSDDLTRIIVEMKQLQVPVVNMERRWRNSGEKRAGALL